MVFYLFLNFILYGLDLDLDLYKINLKMNKRPYMGASKGLDLRIFTAN
jgi:hypothetical protein